MTVEVVAELAQGYEGQPALADVLLSGAIAAGADAVKLQLVLADELATPAHEKYEWYRQLAMDPDVWAGLAKRAHEAGLRIYFDVFGPQSLAQASEIGADGVKMHASEFHNDDLVSSAIKTFDRVFVSVGGIEADEIEAFLSRHDVGEGSPVRMLYGFQAYPTDVADNNLRRFQRLISRFEQVSFGFMDHSPGAEDSAWYVPLMAVAVGAQTIEKHMTLAHDIELTDHWSALTPDEFRSFMMIVRSLEPALGSPTLELGASERKYRGDALKVVVAARPLEAGREIEASDVALKRAPVTAEQAIYRLDQAVGRRTRESVGTDEPLKRGALS